MKRYLVPPRVVFGPACTTLLIAGTLALLSLTATPAPAQSSPPATLDLTGLGMGDREARGIAVTLARGVRSGRDLKRRDLRVARDQMVKGMPVKIDALRALADAGDGLAALRLIRQLEEQGHVAAPENLAHYYGVAATTGRVAGLWGLVRMLKQVDPDATSPARLRRLKDIVLAYALAGNSVASAAMMDFHVAERPFGPLTDDIVRIAVRGQGEGSALIALQLAGGIVQTEWDDPTALAQAKTYLDLAIRSDSVRVKLIAGNLLPVLDARIQRLATAPDVAEPNG